METVLVIALLLGIAGLIYYLISATSEKRELEKKKQIVELQVDIERTKGAWQHEQNTWKMEYDRFKMEMFERTKTLELREMELKHNFKLSKIDRDVEIFKTIAQLRLAQYELGNANQLLLIEAHNKNEAHRIDMMERIYRQERERVQLENEQKRSAYMLALQAIVAEWQAKYEFARVQGKRELYDEADAKAEENIRNLRDSLGI